MYVRILNLYLLCSSQPIQSAVLPFLLHSHNILTTSIQADGKKFSPIFIAAHNNAYLQAEITTPTSESLKFNIFPLNACVCVCVPATSGEMINLCMFVLFTCGGY